MANIPEYEIKNKIKILKNKKYADSDKQGRYIIGNSTLLRDYVHVVGLTWLIYAVFYSVEVNDLVYKPSLEGTAQTAVFTAQSVHAANRRYLESSLFRDSHAGL